MKHHRLVRYLLLLLLLFTGVGQPLRAQYYPIHATVQWPSPQSPYLSDYYSGSRDRLIVNLLNRDLQQPLLFARLRIKIKSTGFLATSREEINYPMLELSANVPTRLTNIDLSPYLQPQNLQINGSLRNGQLPTGYTEFSVQVVDYYTGRTLSAWHTGRSYLDVKKPPILNFPEKDAQIGVTEPLYLRFQWMPRNQGLAGREYEFVLKELPNNGAAPQSAFAYGNEIYRVRTRNTTLNYTHLDPVLFPNRCYAWQVQAIARDGVDEVGMFENGGYSEINWFYLTDDCQAPTGLRAHPRFAKVDLSWNKVIGTTGYIVECRPKTKLNTYEWSRTQIAGEHLTLSQLKLGWTYEWRVGTLCTDDRPVFSGVSEFTLSKQNEELLADCGKEPVRKDLSQEPNLRIKAGDIVTIGGDYPMTITEVVPLGDGWYSGRGKTRLKTIIDAPVALRFDRLRINVDNFQIDGTVEASYDEKKGKIANLDYVDDGGKDIKPATVRIREHKLDFTLPDIPQFVYNPKTGELETTDADGNPQTIKVDMPENGSYERIFPMLVTDNKGNTYQISPSEQNTEGTGNDVETGRKDEKIELNCERVDRVGDFNTESLSSKYGYIHFKPGEGKYAFDDGQEKWYKKSVKVDHFYKPFAKGYIAPWKLVPTGENDVVTAKYDGLRNIDLKKVHFASEPNTAALPAKLNEAEQTWTISLRSVSSGASYDVFAVYEGVVIGKLRVVSYTKQQHKVTLVPINEVKLDKSAIEQQLNTIYNPVGVQFTVNVDESMRGNYDWEVESEKDGLLSTVGKSFWGYDKELKESTEMLNLQKTYQQAAGTLDGVYLFVLNGATGLEGQKGDLLGEMPRKSRFGYIFAGNSPNTEEIVHTIAHELGHGIFTLQHTFDSEYGKGTQGKTNNLLDYPSNLLDYKEKTELVAFQWNVMASPAIFTAMDNAKDGEINLKEGEFLGFTPDGRVILNAPKGYEEIFDNKNSYFIIAFLDKQRNRYQWNGKDYDDGKGHVFIVPDKPVTGKVAIWANSKNPDCYIWYKFIDVKNYTSKDFGEIKRRIKNDKQEWTADYVYQASKDCITKSKKEKEAGIKLPLIHTELSIKEQFEKVGHSFDNNVEFTQNGKVYRRNAQNQIEAVEKPLSDEQINKGIWDDDRQEYKLRFTTDSSGVKIQAFGISSEYIKNAQNILSGKYNHDVKIDGVAISDNIRNKTNILLKENNITDLNSILTDETEPFADGRKIKIDGAIGKVISEGCDKVVSLLKTGEIVPSTYKDKSNDAIQLPGLLTGSIETVSQQVTDLTSLASTIYGVAVDKKKRDEIVSQFRQIKEAVADDPKQFVSILGDVLVSCATGNTPEEWNKAKNSSDEGERSHFATKGTECTILALVATGKAINNLPEAAEQLAKKIKSVREVREVADDIIENIYNGISHIRNLSKKYSPSDIKDAIKSIYKYHTDLAKEPAAIEAFIKAKKNKYKEKYGIRDDQLASITSAKGTGSYADIVNNLNTFVDYIGKNGIDAENLSGLLTRLSSGSDATRMGEAWVLKYLSGNTDNLKSATKLTFEKRENIAGLGMREADLVVEKGKQTIYYEFKSVEGIPPTDFIEQFTKDLTRPGFTQDNLKWVFDRTKVSEDAVKRGIRPYVEKCLGIDFLNDLGDNADEYVEEFINKIFIVK
ncbi:hypothetical protein [Hoylesella shahii]|uniref:Uncharacterized protein n=1 Tax=Hoylesella shahii DSM 15611 = JCM 12083 TaxID=1122991 RepID=A0A318HUP5_9BACT|nr:hypothetical protein [Hoylesella shahii]PXX18885.1 hypothetical protein EJ73_02588 [Hoylesella shahii DSM 15611 = JCM 12083]